VVKETQNVARHCPRCTKRKLAEFRKLEKEARKSLGYSGYEGKLTRANEAYESLQSLTFDEVDAAWTVDADGKYDFHANCKCSRCGLIRTLTYKDGILTTNEAEELEPELQDPPTQV
jgi:hypothetical protein